MLFTEFRNNYKIPLPAMVNYKFPTVSRSCSTILRRIIVTAATAFCLHFISFHFIFIYLGTVAPSVHENCFSGGRGTNVTCLRFHSSLKGGKGWCLFNIKFKAIPKLRSTKRYSPLLVFRKGIERSASVFLSSLTFRVDLFSNKLERYSGTRPLSDLYTVVAVSPLMMSLTVGHCKLCIKPIEGVSKLLFVTILATILQTKNEANSLIFISFHFQFFRYGSPSVREN